MTQEEPKQTLERPTGPKYAVNFKFWRIGADFDQLLIQTSLL